MALTQISGPDFAKMTVRKQAYCFNSPVIPKEQSNDLSCLLWPGVAGTCLAKLHVLQSDISSLEGQLQSVYKQQRALEGYRSQLTDSLESLAQFNAYVRELTLSLSESLHPLDAIFEQLEKHSLEIQKLYGRMDANLQLVQKQIAHVQMHI